MKVAIVGSRTFKDFKLLEKEITNIIEIDHIDEVISGGANGADKVGRTFAKLYKIRYIEFPADWDTYGKAAGYIRNRMIIENSDIVFAFWDGQSKGTEHSINLAKSNKKELHIIYF